jgi:preprotein translocase subunit SecB
MTDTAYTPPGALPPQQPMAGQTTQIRVLSQYLKDLTFQNPEAARGFSTQVTPQINVGIDVGGAPVGGRENTYEVDLRLSAKGIVGGEMIFLCEVVFSGAFQLLNVQQQDVEPLLLIECPALLFPFTRRIMAEVTREGGFPPVLVEPVDFMGLYRAQRLGQPG